MYAIATDLLDKGQGLAKREHVHYKHAGRMYFSIRLLPAALYTAANVHLQIKNGTIRPLTLPFACRPNPKLQAALTC